MPDQPDIKTRIAEILRAHSTTVVQYRDTDAAGCCVRCKCGVPATHHELHVTNKLVAELGLTRESETHPVPVQEYGEDGAPLMHENCVNPVPRMHFEFIPKSRYVTEWVPDVP